MTEWIALLRAAARRPRATALMEPVALIAPATSPSVLLEMLKGLLPLSPITFGGINVVLPELHRFFVDRMHWITSADFYHLLALAFAAPGPNTLFVAMLGSRVAGIPGAVLAMLAVVLPTSLLAGAVAKVWFRAKGNPLREVAHLALLPVTAGIFAAATWAITRAVVHGPLAWILALATLLGVTRSRLHPLWFLLAGGVAGVLAGL